MTETFEPESGNAELWHTVFEVGHPDLLKQHKLHKVLPKKPRCRLCLCPFAGIGGAWLRFRGKKPSHRNPHYCNACDGFLEAFPGGADVNLSILYADICNSVAYAETASPGQVSARISTFLTAATEAITDNDGFVMAFYGDCIVAVFPPGFVGPDHASKALAAAEALAGAPPPRDASGNEIPFGVGVHSGTTHMCTVYAAAGSFRDVSIFGHSVNLTARLAGAAGAGQALASAEVMQAAGRAPNPEAAQSLDLKGVSEPVTAYAL